MRKIFPAKRPLFYYVTDRKGLLGTSVIASIRKAIEGGVDFVQIREKDLEDRALFDLTRSALAFARGTECRILVNGRADIALAAGADGVHLPSTGLQIADIRPWVPDDFLIGVSVHTLSEIHRACAQGADYLLLGHVFPTNSKAAYGLPLGLRRLRNACAASSAPVLGLGGIKAESIDSVLNAGAAGVAGIGLFQETRFRMQNSGYRLQVSGFRTGNGKLNRRSRSRNSERRDNKRQSSRRSDEAEAPLVLQPLLQFPTG
jgi:thiamine-phosphate pyrophosphorylase